jgi:hypothetical protein
VNFTLEHYPSVAVHNYSDTICENAVYSDIYFSGLTLPDTYHDTLRSIHGCDSLIITFTLDVLPQPTLITVLENDTLCDSEMTQSIIFMGTANWYDWTVSGDVSGIPTNGTGDFGNYTVSNQTANSIQSRISVIPKYIAGSKGCVGESQDFEIVVHPATAIHSFIPNMDTLFVCIGKEASMEVQATGKELVYQWYYDEMPLQGAINPSYVIPSVSQADFGAYYVEVSGVCGSENSKKIILTECIPFDDECIPFDQVVIMRWNNTLTVINNPANNGGFKFTSFKWYRNDILISTGQSWCKNRNGEHISPDDEFYVELTAEGYAGVLRTCKSQITLKDKSMMFYPNPVSAGQTVYIDADFEDEFLQDAVVEVYNMVGIHIGTYHAISRQISIDSKYATGVYLFILKGKDEFRKETKVVVY